MISLWMHVLRIIIVEGTGGLYEHHIVGGHRMSAMVASLLIPQFQTIDNDMRIRDNNKQKLDASLSDMGFGIIRL